jgi:hypothetical protein
MAVTAFTWLNQTFATDATSFATTSTALPSGDYAIVSTTGSTTAFSTGTWGISDNAGGTWTPVEVQNSQTVGKSWFRTTPGTGANLIVTITTTVSSGLILLGTRFAGSNGQYVTATTLRGGTITANTVWPSLTTPSAVQAGDLYYAIARGQATSGTWTAGSGWTSLASNTSVNTRVQFSQRRAATASGTVSATARLTTQVSNYSQMAIVIRDASAPPSFTGWGIPL